MSNDRTTNSKILQEYYTQHRTDLSRLEPRVKTKWEMATKIVDNLYAFPVSSCPWETNYFSTTEFLNSEGEFISGNLIPTEGVRRNRANWLLGRAENVYDHREIDSWFAVGLVWGAVAAQILFKTYLAQETAKEETLPSQKQLLDNMSLIGSVQSSGKTHLRKLLKQHTFNAETQENINAPLNSFKPLLGNVKQRYYCRVNARMVFCIKSVVDGANLLSQKIVNNERHWNEGKDRWIYDLGHTMDIVDYCVELKKQDRK